MKLLHVIVLYNIGGAEMMLARLVGALGAPRYEHVVISLGRETSLTAHFRDSGVDVRCIGLERGRPSFAGLWHLRRIIDAEQPDILHGWMYHGNLAATVATIGTRHRLPVLWSIRQSLYSLQAEKAMTRLVIHAGKYFSSRAHLILYNSETSTRQHEAYGYCRHKSLVIPNGFDTDCFKPDSEARRAVRAELRIPKDSILIGLVARYHPMKDHGNFFRAATLLMERHSNVHFLLIGTGVTEEHRVFARLMHKCVVRDRIHLLGERQDIPRLTAALDIACSASAWGEGFSNAIGEAMACAVPCVGTDVGDTRKIIGDTGFVVPPGDAEALVAAWCTLIECGRQCRGALGQRARWRILKRYSLAAVAQQYAQVYARTTGAN
ncbi:MAG: glycosyltransferase [Nitrococcus sp.]|nr:glycosyltransferase [Nitrococcus sp.]